MNCLIIDDEPWAREGLRDLVATRESLVLLRTFSSPQGVLDYLASTPVELVFLDIEMPGHNGLEFAKALPTSTMVIFTTAYAEYALQSYDVEAIDYLVKPIAPPRFHKAVDKAEHHLKLLGAFNGSVENIADGSIIIMSDRRYCKIPFRNILYVEGIKDYVVVHTAQEDYVTWLNLKTIHAKLPPHQFVRISKRCVVNLESVVAYDSTSVQVQDTDLALGKAYQQDFYERARQLG
jgi:DNA-binding LytR/AlgR family response regulator